MRIDGGKFDALAFWMIGFQNGNLSGVELFLLVFNIYGYLYITTFKIVQISEFCGHKMIFHLIQNGGISS